MSIGTVLLWFMSAGTALLWWKFHEDQEKRQQFSEMYTETFNETSQTASETFNQTFYHTNETINETSSGSFGQTHSESEFVHLASVASLFTVRCYICAAVVICHFYFYNNFGKCQPIVIISFTVAVVEVCGIKSSTSPQICDYTT